jgi:hypothetical protein
MSLEQMAPIDSANAGRDKRSVALEAADFWQLRAFVKDVEAIELDFLRVRREFDLRLREAIERRDRVFANLQKKYGLRENGKYRCDDSTCALVEE